MSHQIVITHKTLGKVTWGISERLSDLLFESTEAAIERMPPAMQASERAGQKKMLVLIEKTVAVHMLSLVQELTGEIALGHRPSQIARLLTRRLEKLDI